MPKTGQAQETISQADFTALMARRTERMIRLARCLADYEVGSVRLTRPLVGELLLHSTQLEELLDAYGALHNKRWRHFRACMAIMKRFSGVAYELLHIRHVLPSYRLLAIEGDFTAATAEAMSFTSEVIIRTAERTLA